MRHDMIRQMVRDLFDTIGEVAVSATLRQKTQGAYEPGSGASETTTDTTIRLVRTEKSLADSQNAAGSPINPALHYALMECEDVTPKADDDLVISAETFTLLQVVAVDTGAGILYEVSYQ
jgi:propanediol dehydratase small subunit